MEEAFGRLRREEPLDVKPFHTLVPTFGTWGFVVAGPAPIDPGEIDIPVPTRYVSGDMLPGLFVFPPDMAEVETPLSRLDHPAVSYLYRRGYHRYLE
jgi:spermidine synthase